MLPTDDLHQHWLAVLEAEQARRRALAAREAGEGERRLQELIGRLAAMAGRLAAGARPGNAELAAQLAQAPDWDRVDALRAPHDLSPAEAIALTLTHDRSAALRLLSGYVEERAQVQPG